jgi:hypothetical protein
MDMLAEDSFWRKDTPGGTATSKTVIVDCKGTLLEWGGHIDLKIDDGRYKTVTLPLPITGLSVGTHTIYLRAVDKDGTVDPTTLKFTFIVISNDNYPETWINSVRTPRTKEHSQRWEHSVEGCNRRLSGYSVRPGKPHRPEDR